MTATIDSLIQQPLQLCASHRRISEDVEQVLAHLTGSHLFQPKLDGMRCLAIVNGGSTSLRSREGDDITRVYPEVVAALAKLNRKVVLDGELVHYGPDGRPAFTAMSWRNSQRNAAAIARSAASVPVSFVAFDTLWYRKEDLRTRPLVERLDALESLRLTQTVQRCPSTEDGLALWEQVQHLQLEGVVAKRSASRYTGQRSLDWIKVKTIHRASVIVGNVLASERRAVGKVEVHVLDRGALVPLGEVGTGWTMAELANVARSVRRYAAAPDQLDPVVIDVDFAGRYPDGKLKFAAFKGLRTDIDWTSCTIDQEGL